MTDLEELIDILWLYSTHENHPWTVDEAYAALKDGGDLVIDGLIFGLQQADVDLKLLVLQLLQEFYNHAERALLAVRGCIEDTHRLVRVTAINTCGIMGDNSPDLVRMLTPMLDSSDDFERIVSAGNLWRISRSEDAFVVLWRETATEGSRLAEMAQGILDE